ncbi:hypothetical protein HDF08_003686 [Edaphobacter lichenicola]|uniref:Uncharacterized protein n=1 Tax=Tunturiibacter lichenicola TaxID=2051959 RepID=A0A852VIP2_9BACT|nr:hypothetical protein [Edaphobacter lichenicola]
MGELRSIRTTVDFIACPIGLALWEEYRRRNAHGVAVPPECPEDHPDQELAPYFDHVSTCENCNEI